ncbi:MAG: sulfurtransferase TusA family protein [Cyanobacteria bacterium K_DeepCast_35m_m2_023]|nr:sulfurtransferase TusA family protein [Cyanobacteria bacterium K_DeepCast_35m_m2_023]
MTELDLRGTPCPLNFIRTKLALETLAPGQALQVALDAGEPAQMVSEGVMAAGHGLQITAHPDDPQAVVLLIHRHG